MKKDFDFDDIGKQTPYTVPEGFFEDMQRTVMERVGIRQRRKSHLKLVAASVVAVAAMLAGILFAPSLFRTENAVPSSDVLAVERSNGADALDGWIKELSDEELEELVNFSENDIFLN